MVFSNPMLRVLPFSALAVHLMLRCMHTLLYQLLPCT